MRLEASRRRKVLINVTSLIDVVFLLLLFFVVTSTFLEQPGLDLELPAAGAQAAAREDEVVVRLTAAGGLFLGELPVAAPELAAALERALAGRPGRRVVVAADARVAHGRVVAVMDAAREAGARGVVVATRPDEPPSRP